MRKFGQDCLPWYLKPRCAPPLVSAYADAMYIM